MSRVAEARNLSQFPGGQIHKVPFQQGGFKEIPMKKTWFKNKLERQKRNREILALLKHGWTRKEVAKRFDRSVYAISVIKSKTKRYAKKKDWAEYHRKYRKKHAKKIREYKREYNRYWRYLFGYAKNG